MPGPVLIYAEGEHGGHWFDQEDFGFAPADRRPYQLRNCGTETGECLCVCGTCGGTGYSCGPHEDGVKACTGCIICPDCATRQRCVACERAETTELQGKLTAEMRAADNFENALACANSERDELVEALEEIISEPWRNNAGMIRVIARAALAKLEGKT